MGALGYELFVGLATQVIDPVRKEELVWSTPPDSFIIIRSSFIVNILGSWGGHMMQAVCGSSLLNDTTINRTS